MLKVPSLTNYHGFSLIEVLLAVAVFGLLVTAVAGAYTYGQESTAIAGLRTRANSLGEEGLEAARNIRDENFANATTGTFGLGLTGNQWTLTGSQDTTDSFIRQLAISNIDSKTKQIQSNITWQQNGQRSGLVSLITQLTNWHIAKPKGGMLVYSNGDNTTDAIQYKTLDGETSIWSSAGSTADVDTGTTNKVLRQAQIYGSLTRHEKVLLTRHSTAAGQFIYAQVYSGITGTWGNVVQLSTWANTTFLDVDNFSGTYLANGDFMVVYSDNTSVPSFRVWNGSSWSTQVSMQNLGAGGDKPSYIVARARPGTNEVMAAFFDQGKDARTEYFNGGTYTQANWTPAITHASNAQTNLTRMIDFAWSTNDVTKGGLAYNDNTKSLLIKIWTANGTGGGTWSSSAASAVQSAVPRSIAIAPRKGADEFIACDKDNSGSPIVKCFVSNFTPTWTNPTNNTIVSGTDSGIQRSFDIGFESVSGALALNIYSDTTSTPKLKKYTAATSTWDGAATNLSTLIGTLETVRMIPNPTSNDIMVLLGDTSQKVYSVDWDGSAGAMYTTPSGKAFTAHTSSGSADENRWYDFDWDRY